jgi:hypothetical protein
VQLTSTLMSTIPVTASTKPVERMSRYDSGRSKLHMDAHARAPLCSWPLDAAHQSGAA